jgi:hypothetical protein
MPRFEAKPIVSTSCLKVKVLTFPTMSKSNPSQKRRTGSKRGTLTAFRTSHRERSVSPPSLEVCFNCHELGDPCEHGSCGVHDLIPLCRKCESDCPLCELDARHAELFRLWNRTQEFVETGLVACRWAECETNRAHTVQDIPEHRPLPCFLRGLDIK